MKYQYTKKELYRLLSYLPDDSKIEFCFCYPKKTFEHPTLVNICIDGVTGDTKSDDEKDDSVVEVWLTEYKKDD